MRSTRTLLGDLAERMTKEELNLGNLYEKINEIKEENASPRRKVRI